MKCYKDYFLSWIIKIMKGRSNAQNMCIGSTEALNIGFSEMWISCPLESLRRFPPFKVEKKKKVYFHKTAFPIVHKGFLGRVSWSVLWNVPDFLSNIHGNDLCVQMSHLPFVRWFNSFWLEFWSRTMARNCVDWLARYLENSFVCWKEMSRRSNCSLLC